MVVKYFREEDSVVKVMCGVCLTTCLHTCVCGGGGGGGGGAQYRWSIYWL